MKIYSQIVFDINSGKIVSEVSEDYHGPISECKGGGSSTTTTVDPVYNAGMLEISKEQQSWARQMFNMFKYGVTYDPSEKVTGYYDSSGKFVEGKPAAAKSGKIDTSGAPPEYIGEGKWKKRNPEYDDYINRQKEAQKEYVTLTRGELQGYDASGQTSEMQYLQNLVNANQSLLGLQTGLSKAQLESQTRLLPHQENLTLEQIAAQRRLLPQQTAAQESRLGLYNTTMQDINKGINVGQRMDQAQAAVQHAFKNTNQTNRMDIASYGLDPSSGRYASQNRAAALAESAGIAGARTTAKNYAEAEDFERKKAGLNFQI